MLDANPLELLEELNDFLDNQVTIRCGENGCNSCHLAYHRACAPITRTQEFVDEEDTVKDVQIPFYDDEDYVDLGGEG